MKLEPGAMPVGVIVGSVEIVDCKWLKSNGSYGYRLEKPRRYKKFLQTKRQPQPLFFFPFRKKV